MTPPLPRRQLAVVCVPMTLVALLGVGCLSVDRPYPVKRQYAFESRGSERDDATVGGVLELRKFQAAPPFDQREFIYKTGPSTFETDFYHVFFAQPAALAWLQARRRLQDSGLLDAVIARGSLAAPDYYLEGSLVALYGDYTQDDRSQAVLEMQFLLLEDREGRTEPLATWTFRESVPVDGRAPGELVDAWSDALAGVLDSLREALREALASGSPQISGR